MQLFHLYHNHKLYRLFHSDFWLFELSIWLHVFANSLVSIFIPILLLKAGYTLGTVIIYYVLYNGIDVPLNLVARALVRRIGARWVIAWGTVFAALFLLMLGYIKPGSWPMLITLAALSALYDAFYWVAHIYLFIESDTRSEDAGKSTGTLYAVKNAAGFVAPALGAILLIFFDDYILITASIIFYVLSLIILIRVDEFPDRPKGPSLSFKEFFSDWKERKNFALTSLYSLHASAEGVLWPLFIFVVFGTLESVALVPIVVSITTIVFSYLVGHIARTQRDWSIGLGALLIAGVWVLRMLFETPVFLYSSIFLVGLFSLFVSIPIDSDLFTRAKLKDPLNASMYRNAFHMFIKFVFYGVLALMVNFFHVSFAVAALSMFMVLITEYLFVRRYLSQA